MNIQEVTRDRGHVIERMEKCPWDSETWCRLGRGSSSSRSQSCSTGGTGGGL